MAFSPTVWSPRCLRKISVRVEAHREAVFFDCRIFRRRITAAKKDTAAAQDTAEADSRASISWGIQGRSVLSGTKPQ